MEPVATALVKAGTEAADVLVQKSEQFLHIVLGAPAKAFGGLIADKINARRHANLVKITVKAKQRLDEAGISPKEVPLKIIHPLLESASLEESPELQAMWAALLAGTASEGTESQFAGFVEILKQLSTQEARFLKALWDGIHEKAAAYDKLSDDDKKNAVRPSLGRVGSEGEIQELFCDVNGLDKSDGDGRGRAVFSLENILRLGIFMTRGFGRSSYGIGPFGTIFLAVCCGELEDD